MNDCRSKSSLSVDIHSNWSNLIFAQGLCTRRDFHYRYGSGIAHDSGVRQKRRGNNSPREQKSQYRFYDLGARAWRNEREIVSSEFRVFGMYRNFESRSI